MEHSRPFRDNWVTVPSVRGHKATVYGVKTHFVEAGEGLPIIMLHGGSGTGESAWAYNIPGLAPEFRAIGLDQIGSGYTDKPAVDYSFQMIVDHLAGFIDVMGFEKVGLVGQSTGGYIAARYTCDYPERVFGLTMINTSTVTHSMDIRLKEPSEGMNISHAFDWTREGLLAELDVLMHNKAAITDELVDYKMKVAMLPGRKEARDSINEYRRSIDQNPDRWQLFNLVHRLPNITVPSLLIWGVEDRFALIELGRRLTKVLPNTEYVEVADASHHGFRDRPEVYNDLLLRFFQAAAAGRKPAAVGR